MKNKFLFICLSIIVLSLVFTSGCKKFDITGNWNFTGIWYAAQSGTANIEKVAAKAQYVYTLTFTGTRESGTWTSNTGERSGTYTVSDMSVIFNDTAGYYNPATYNGTASDDFNTITGTTIHTGGGTGTFTMIRL